MLQSGSLLAGQPLLLLVTLCNVVQYLLQHLGCNNAHVMAPLLPERIQMMVEALGFCPLGAVEAHDFIGRQNKLQLPPHQPAFAMDRQKLVKRNEIFVAFTGDFHSRIQEDHLVIWVLRQAFA